MKNQWLLLSLIFVCLHSVSISSDGGTELISLSSLEELFASKGRSIEDVLVDQHGFFHTVSTNTVLNNETPDAGALFYSRVDSAGFILTDERITKGGRYSHPRVGTDVQGDPFVFYFQGCGLFFARFDSTGRMLTPMSYFFTNKDLGPGYDYSFELSGSCFVFARANYDYLWTLDNVGNKISEVRSRLLAMVSSDGFAVTMLDTSSFLLVWHGRASDEKRREGYFRTDSLKYMTVATDLKSASTVHSVALEQVAAAEVSEDLQLATPRVLRTRDGVRVVTASGKTGSTSRTMVVTFDSTGTLVPRSPLEHIARKEVIHASAAGSGVVLHAIHDIYGRAVKPFVLYGFTPDGQVVVHDSSRQK